MLNFRHNIMKVLSIESFAGVKGGMNGSCKDVYFLRAVGAGSSFCESVEKLDKTLLSRMKSGALIYTRFSSLPNITSPEDAAFYSGCYEDWSSGGKKLIKLRTAFGNELGEVLSNAVKRTLELFNSGKAGANSSIEKNFAVKMLFWLDSLCSEIIQQWDAKKSIKIVADNIVKRQEYLFFYMLTLLGCDVLLLQSRSDIGDAEKQLALSDEFRLGEFSDKPVPVYNPELLSRSEPDRKPDAPAPHVSSAGADSSSPIRITIPERPGRASSSGSFVIPERPRNNTPASRSIIMPDRTGSSTISAGADLRTAERASQRKEKAFEDLAKLASSVVMIAICDATGRVKGTGSGIMIGRDGYILTNNHVASGGRYYAVRIEEDDKIYTTEEIIKYNPMLDLAIIRIDRRLKPIPVYNGTQKLVRGQKVVAIGSPMGLFNSVSDGIISGFRKIRDVDMIQFTAPISHGSSGGAVLNMYGEVIGISTAGIDEGQNLNLAMGYEVINSFIRGFI